jgi:hypothetical protein
MNWMETAYVDYAQRACVRYRALFDSVTAEI